MPTITLIKSDLTTKTMHPNPKEKAKELFSTYRFLLSIPDAPLGENKDRIAVQCALTLVDEIINFLNRCPSFNKGKETDEIWGYWQSVKSELTNQK